MIRIGHSWDVHRLVEGRKLILGGIEIDGYSKGLLGHSDADCVLHSLAEALLGSLALGDLGDFFPDTAKETLNLVSKIILKNVYEIVKNKGYKLVNCDIMIYSEMVKIAPYKFLMRQEISKILDLNIENISIKATTWEKMGFIGRNEAIAAETVILISNSN